MTKIEYSENVKAFLRASGMTEEAIVRSEAEANLASERFAAAVFAELPESLRHKFESSPLTPLGADGND
jgi:hypothetical protein